MWDLGNRSVVALVSVLSGCVFLYNVWGPILIVTILLFLTIYACYSLITNDSLLSPHASFLFDYCVRVFLEVRANFENIVDYVYRHSRIFWETANRRFLEVFLTKIGMERRRGPHYQLSTDSYPTRRNSSKFDSIAQLSPISRNVRESNVNELTSENKVYCSSNHSLYTRGSFSKLTSTPLLSRNKEEFENESSNQSTSQRIPAVYSHHRSLTRSEEVSYFSSEGSPWGTTISPKAHPTMNDSKSPLSQTRPLSVSTRYNIDPRVYSDVTSPGLSTRLTKYAAEANSRFTRQSQYHVGQFPKVNLQGSPVPVINPKCVKTRTPVTVRVAPPDAVRYSPPGKQKILSNLCDIDDSLASSSVPYGLREMSLKRHASREDVAFDLAKKQRIGGVTVNELELQDETKQKRSRDESSKSEEDVSPQSKNARPAKRTKTPSCYDILNSFSSSKNVVSGIKRKARDLSRSGTPDFEKHFKSLESVPNSSIQTLPEAQIKNVTYQDHDTTEKKHSNVQNSLDEVQGKLSPLKGILKTSSKALVMDLHDREVCANLGNRYNGETRTAETPVFVDSESTRLTNKLFMRAEPERNEKLRMLVEEQGNIRAKFTTDDVEEIRKEDIADMRQTSMKARLQSMFDAISGKATSKINPDVVIQAEEVNTVKSVPCPASCATLNSSTTTTNANTTPISTSAIVPSPETKSSKHVAFILPNKETSLDSSVSSGNSKSVLTGSSGNTFTVTSGNTIFSSSATNVNSAVSNHELSNATNVSSPTILFASGAGLSNHQAASTTSTSSLVTATTSAVPSGTSFGVATSVTFNSLTTPVTSSLFSTRTNQNPIVQLNVPHSAEKVSSASPLLSGNNIAFSSPVPNNVTWNVATTSAVESKSQSTLAVNVPAITNSSAPTFTMSSTSLFTFGNTTTSPQALKSEASFVFGSNVGQNNAQNSGGLANLTARSQSTPMLNANQVAPLSNFTANTPATTVALISDAKTTVAPFRTSPISTFSFGASTSVASNKTGFTFGGIAATTVTTVALTTTTIVTTTTAATIAATTAVTMTAAPTLTAINTSTTTPNTILFGTSNANSSKTFGSSMSSSGGIGITTSNNTNTSHFGSSVNSIFGTATTSSTGSMFGTTQCQPVFGASSISNTTGSGGSTSAVTLFNSTPTITTTSMNNTPIFSNTVPGSTSGMTSTSPTSIFGSVANASSSSKAAIRNAASSNIFSNANSTSTFGTTSNMFGQTKPLTENLKSTTGAFASNPTPLFGTPSTTVATFNSSNPSSNAITPIFGSTIVSSNTTTSVFAATSVTSSAFGSQNNTILGGQNNALQAFGGRTNIFGSDSSASTSASTSVTPVFGASVSTSSSTPLFGASVSTSAPTPVSASSTFTRQSVTNPTPVFGTPVNASGSVLGSTGAFGDSKPPSFGQALPFATSNATTTVFRTGNVTNANNTANTTNASGIFTFGANQKPPQQAGTFPFSSNANPNSSTASSASTPFQFGATASKPAATTGFNFSAPTTTPNINFGTTSAPTFNASMPGMFSIGSGSTAPRSRSVRTRKPR